MKKKLTGQGQLLPRPTGNKEKDSQVRNTRIKLGIMLIILVRLFNIAVAIQIWV